MQLPAWNEALGLPRPWDQQWSLRLQQILAYETDLLEYGDIFDGSKVIDAKVDELKAEAQAEMARIDDMGGAVAAIEVGYMKQRLVESNPARLAAIETGEQTVVGVNAYTETEPSPLTAGDGAILTVDPAVEREQIERLQGLARRARRRRPSTRRSPTSTPPRKEDRNIMGRRSPAPRPASPPANGADAARGVRRVPRADRRRARAPASATAGSSGARARSRRRRGARPALKILVGKPGLDGHSNGAEQIAVRARDAAWRSSTRASA